MSIIVCPHMGHSFFLPADIHHTSGYASYYLFWQARCPRQRPSGPCAHSGKGVALHALDKAKEALECFDRAIKMDPDHAYAHSRKGSLLHNSESQAQNACSSAPI